MWFGVIVTLKNQRKFNQRKAQKNTVQDQELSSDNFSTVQLQLTMHACMLVTVCDSVSERYLLLCNQTGVERDNDF